MTCVALNQLPQDPSDKTTQIPSLLAAALQTPSPFCSLLLVPPVDTRSQPRALAEIPRVTASSLPAGKGVLHEATCV